MDEHELQSTQASDDPEVGASTLVGAAIASAEGASVELGPGATLGRYVVLSRMGEGAMGVVYAAYDPELDRRIALKLMHQRGSDELEAERVSARMLAEAQALARLSHPNVITVHDVGTLDGRVFIAMEFVEGVSLTRWLAGDLHGWQAILDIFVRAGRGLAAAHAAGIVHRDFKPDNVLVGVDGRVRVLDFGLARRLDGGQAQVNVGGAERRDREAGTPAYMSPEQHLGVALDHRADQFSFCVALYEALYDEPPFQGKTRIELALAVTDGQVAPAPKGTLVPSWIRAALLRGLDPDPARRWDGMTALLGALTRDPHQKARRLAVGVVAAALLGASIGLLVEVGFGPRVAPVDPVQRCAKVDARVTEVWNDDRRARLRSAFAAVHEPWAASLGAEVEASLDRWTSRWASMRRQACEATALGEQSDSLMDRRMLCLDRRLAELDELVAVVSEADRRGLARAGEAVRALPDLAECTAAAIEADRDRAGGEPSGDLRRLAVGELERDLFRARGLALTGAFREAAALVDSSLVGAELIADRRLRASALLVMAEIAQMQGELELVVPLLEDAELEAERAAADRLRADVLVALARAEIETGEVEAGRRRLQRAQAALDRVHADELDYAGLDGVAGLAAIAAGEAEQAEPLLAEAITRVTKVRDAADGEAEGEGTTAAVQLAELRTIHASALRQLGRFAEARAELLAARAAWIELYGEQHPRIAAVELEQARIDADEGRDVDALRGYAVALERLERAHGPGSLDVAEASEAMAVSLARLGRYDEALRRSQQARAIFRAKLGGERLDNLAAVALAKALDHEALIRRELSQLDVALSLHQQALVLLDRDDSRLPVRIEDRARVRVHLGELMLELGRPAEAREPLEQALQLLTTATLDGPSLRARARFAAAQAWAVEPDADLSRARALALEAREGFAALGDRDRVIAVEAWLAR